MQTELFEFFEFQGAQLLSKIIQQETSNIKIFVFSWSTYIPNFSGIYTFVAEITNRNWIMTRGKKRIMLLYISWRGHKKIKWNYFKCSFIPTSYFLPPLQSYRLLYQSSKQRFQPCWTPVDPFYPFICQEIHLGQTGIHFLHLRSPPDRNTFKVLHQSYSNQKHRYCRSLGQWFKSVSWDIFSPFLETLVMG